MFTHDVVLHADPDADDARQIWLGRVFVIGVVAVTYALSLFNSRSVFDLGVWCFSGFAGLVPVVWSALYWRRATASGAIASVLAVVVTWVGLFAWDTATGTEGEFLVAGAMPVTWIFLASVVAMVGVSLATRPPEDAVLARFFRLVQPSSASRQGPTILVSASFAAAKRAVPVSTPQAERSAPCTASRARTLCMAASNAS